MKGDTVTHGIYRWVGTALVIALFASITVALIVVACVKSLVSRATPNGVRARLARRRANLVSQRTPGEREGRTSAALAVTPAAAEAGIGPATRARLIGVDELMIDDSDERTLFI